MIKNYSNNSTQSNAVSFILRASKKRRAMAMANAKEIQYELGISPRLVAVK